MNTADIDTEPPVSELDPGPRSPIRTVQILHELARTKAGVPLMALAARLHLPKTSVFRLLRSLEAGGYVTSVNGVHRIGPEALKLGLTIVHQREFPNSARPTMDWLSDQCNETIIVGILSDNRLDVVYSEVVDANKPLRFTIKPGVVKPLYCSANGLTILAYMSDKEQQHYLKTVKLVRQAPATIATIAELKRRLHTIRATGVSVSVDGMFEGVFSVAAPVVDAARQVHAGVSISAPNARGLKDEAKLTALVRTAGKEISRVLGYTGPYPPPE